MKTPKSKPFLKWVGGKRQLLPEIYARLPQRFAKYHEPFLGGGALFFDMGPPLATINDYNSEIMNCYRVIQDDDGLEELIDHLLFFDSGYQKASAEERAKVYYEVRKQDRIVRHKLPPSKMAARTIFLNKTGYNGLYRLNKRGEFNVPHGRYATPNICDEVTLRACHEVLRGIELRSESFEYVLDHTAAGDFVYLDPPYVPLSVTANFTSYTSDGFGIEEQKKLFAMCQELDKKGVYWLFSNSSAPWIQETYKDFRLELVDARRAINSKPTKRGKIKEVLVSNY